MTSLRFQRLAILLTAVVVALACSAIPSANAGQSVPRRMVFNSRLLKSNGTPVTTPHKVRFTFWIGSDAVPSDLTGTGAINITAPNFGGWQEEQSITPDSNGNFYVEMGSVRALPSFAALPPSTLSNLFLQVEVKDATLLDSHYEILDPKPLDPVIDRSPILSVPFAINADRLDQRDVGTGSGSIPVLGSGGTIALQNGARGTFGDAFTIDADHSAANAVTLKFGDTLNKTLQYNITNTRFEFNDDVRIDGDLTVTGLVNGLDLNSLSSGTASVLHIVHAEYPDATFTADGSDNVGQLSAAHDGISADNFYQWTSTRAGLQDYDIVVKFTLPRNFIGWEASAITLHYKTSSPLVANSKVDTYVFDSDGNPVSIVGGIGLASTTWASSAISFTGSPVWNPGSSFLMKIRLSAKGNALANIGDIELRYID